MVKLLIKEPKRKDIRGKVHRMKGVVLVGLIGFLLIIGMFFGLGFSTGATITVDDDPGEDYFTIQEGINHANTDDTIRVYTGIYHENITIDEDVTIEGDYPWTTYLHGDLTIESGQTDVEVKKMSIIGGDVSLTDEHSTEESGIDFTNCYIYEGGGVDIQNAENVHFTNCAIFNHGSDGLWLDNCDDVTIESCRIFNNSYNGIEFRDVNGDSSNYCKIKNTFIFSNDDHGIYIQDVNSNDSNYIEIERAHIFNNSGHGIYLDEGTYFRINESIIYDNSDDGIRALNIDNISISDCSIMGNYLGIYLDSCKDITIDDCNIADTDGTGILLSSVTSTGGQNVIKNCNVMNTGGKGISLSSGSDEVYIKHCNILDATDDHGIYISNNEDTSYYYEIVDCVVYHCDKSGIYIDADDDGSNNNVVIEHSCLLWNKWYGIDICDGRVLVGNEDDTSKCNNFLQNGLGNADDGTNGDCKWGEDKEGTADDWGNYWGDSSWISGIDDYAEYTLDSGVDFFYIDSDYTSAGSDGTYDNPYKRLTAAVGWNDKVFALDWGKYDNSNPNYETFPIWINHTEKIFARPEGTGADEYVMIDSENPARIGEPIILNQLNTLIAGFRIESSGTNYDGLSSTHDDCVIYNNTIKSSRHGINVTDADRTFIVDNTCYDNSKVGIRLNYTSSSTKWNVITGNTVYSNDHHGIRVSDGTDSTGAWNNIITLNTCYDNGDSVSRGSGIFIGTDSQGNTISRNKLSPVNNNQNKNGIYLYDGGGTSNTKYNNIIMNTCNDNSGFGIKSDFSKNNWIVSNSFSFNDKRGFEIETYSDKLRIINNKISQNGETGDWEGLEIQSNCDNNLVVSNTIIKNSGNNVFLSSNVDTNYFILNNISEADDAHGIHISGNTWSKCEDNVIWYNTFYDNDDGTSTDYYGVYLNDHTEDNIICYNNFIDNGGGNEDQAYDNTDYGNSWHDGNMGNYWNDWDEDGSYPIDGDGSESDDYPRKHQFSI